MKYILISLIFLLFIGCQHETQTPTVENKPSNDGWKLEYFHKVKIQNEELYECVYGRGIGWNGAAAFSILSNTACRETL